MLSSQNLRITLPTVSGVVPIRATALSGYRGGPKIPNGPGTGLVDQV